MGYCSVRWTMNRTDEPLARVMVTISPRRSSRSRKKTAGPDLESTWPRITADPGSPGRVPGAYQPATSHRVGAWTVLSDARPSRSRALATPKSGDLHPHRHWGRSIAADRAEAAAASTPQPAGPAPGWRRCSRPRRSVLRAAAAAGRQHQQGRGGGQPTPPSGHRRRQARPPPPVLDPPSGSWGFTVRWIAPTSVLATPSICR